MSNTHLFTDMAVLLHHLVSSPGQLQLVPVRRPTAKLICRSSNAEHWTERCRLRRSLCEGWVVQQQWMCGRGELRRQCGGPLGQPELVLTDQGGRVDHGQVEGAAAHLQLLLSGIWPSHSAAVVEVVMVVVVVVIIVIAYTDNSLS